MFAIDTVTTTVSPAQTFVSDAVTYTVAPFAAEAANDITVTKSIAARIVKIIFFIL